VVGPLASADAYAERHGVRHAIVAIPTLAASRLQTMLDRRNPAFDRVQFVPDLAGLPSEDVFASSIDGMLALEVRIGLYNAANRAVKRAWDIAGSVMLLALASPVLLALYLWVRADSRGAGLHASHRIGEGGRPFACLKFRTMHVDAEQRLGELLETDARLRHEYARFHKLTSDPRVTRAGRVLRRLSLDELPQLFNVLRGEMSLVGPRPYLARELPDIGAIQDILFRAKPGMTGYWQVTARNNVTFRDRLQMEAHYVRNWSIWWDIILLTQTPAVVLRRRGAK
jgi:Undecaprenyl-phosphate galactose phosphotransferase WbaP